MYIAKEYLHFLRFGQKFINVSSLSVCWKEMLKWVDIPFQFFRVV